MFKMTAAGGRGSHAALVPLLLATSGLVGIQQAKAQEKVAAIETVVVTAEKRSEDLQRVPFSITALNTEKLTQLEVHNFNDYVKYLPSVTFTVGQPSGGGNGAGGFATVTMRGVSTGNDGNHSGSLPTVGVYLDEEPITTIGGTLDVNVYDIARVEALEGPQGTLYGASSEAGTIRIITNKPDPSAFSASFDVEGNAVQHGGLGGTVQGYVNVPIAENAAIRLVAWDEHDAGFIDNVHGTRTFPTSGIVLDNSKLVRNDFNTVDKYGARAALKVDLNENWTATAAVMGQNEDSNGIFGFDPNPRYGGDLKVSHFFPEFTHDYWYQAALTIEGKIGNLDLVYSGSHMQRWVHDKSDYTDYGYWYDKVYPEPHYPGYNFGIYFYDNSGNYIAPAQHIDAKDRFVKDSDEIRISSPSSDRLRFVAGLFYERQSHWIFQDYLIDNLASSLWVPGWFDTIWLTDQVRVDRDYAAFGEVTYDVTPKLTVTGGARVFAANNSIAGFFGFSDDFSSHTGESQCFSPEMFHGAPCINLDKSVHESGYTHKLSMKYQIDDDRMVYFTWSTGFRPGGVNRRSTIPPYHSDKLTNYEVGWKTTWMDGTLRFNGAAFWDSWANVQFSQLGVNSFTEIRNAGSATVQGIEGDLQYVPTEHLTLTAAGTYADAKLDHDFCGFGDTNICPGPNDPYPPEAPKGQQLPGSSRYKFNMEGRYQVQIGDFLTHFQATLAYQSSEWPDLRNAAPDPLIPDPPKPVLDPIRPLLGKQHGFTTIDLSSGVERDAWSLEFFIKNITDTRGDLYRFTECATQVCGNETYRVPITPRLFGLRYSQKFD
jgi:iron complex outermembrane recepter protein